jgi:glycosyltransferase involved in cell wall biosynthesis
MTSIGEFTLIVPFYRNGRMLERQIAEWELYPPSIHLLIVDDGSPEPARDVIEARASALLRRRLSLYRIQVDIPWNREEARNLGTGQARTQWIVHVDIDHLMPREAAETLLEFQPNPRHWYRFPRWRRGKADETRKKDAIPVDCDFGRIHEHMDSYLIDKDLYSQAGGYDLRFSGCLGGGSDFLKRLEAFTPARTLPDSICLHVYTRDTIADASDWCLSRDTTEGKRRARAKRASGKTYQKCAVVSPWERLL